MLWDICDSTVNEEKLLCIGNLCQLCATLVSCLFFFIAALYLKLKNKFRCYHALQKFHNMRTVLELLLFLVGTLELSSAFSLQRNRPLDILWCGNYFFTTVNALISPLFGLLIGVYHYGIEFLSFSGHLYCTFFISLVVSIIRAYKLIILLHLYDIQHLEVCINASACLFLLSLAAIDGYLIYEKRFALQHKSFKSEPADGEYGYKHTIAPFLSKMFFLWLTPMLWKGYNCPLEQEDIGPFREDDSARSHYDHFLFIYKTTKAKHAKLWLCYFKSSWKLFILGGFLKLLSDLSALVGPLSIYYIVEYLDRQQNLRSNFNTPREGKSNNSTKSIFGVEGNINNETTKYDGVNYIEWTELISNGWVIAWFVLVSSLAQGAFSQGATHIVNMIGIRIKTSLQGLVYRKTLLLSSSCLHVSKVENDRHSFMPLTHGNDVGTITNLMSEDALNVMTFFWIVHYVWSIPLKVGFIMYLLYLKLGVSAIIGSCVCIFIMIPLQFFIGRSMSSNAEKTAEWTDQRIKKINDIFLGVKFVKLNAWEKLYEDKIITVREKELSYLNRDSIFWFLMTSLAHISSVFIALVTLAFFIRLNEVVSSGSKSDRDEPSEFTASRLFSTLALFNQLTVPLFIFPVTVPVILSAIVSTRRLEKFLHEPEVEKELEGIRNMARILSKSDASLDIYESSNEPSFVEVSEQVSEEVPEIPTEIKTEYDFQSYKDSNSLSKRKTELVRNSRIESIRLRQKSKPTRESIRLSVSDNIAVAVRDAEFSWDHKNVCLGVNLVEIPKGKLTVIIGKNGSGKTAFIYALLKEIYTLSGEVTWNKYATIAYVPQNEWLLNATIRENILFGESFRPKRYERILDACALKPDLELMPAGDMTIIGERGINISGGQRQRIVIARSLYSCSNTIIMDDPFSSLDNEIAQHVFESTVKNMCLKANRTVILVTQQLQLLYNADYIITIKDKKVLCAGTYCEIERKYPDVLNDWNSILLKNCSMMKTSGRTARERWQLLKNISKLGLQHATNVDAEFISPMHSVQLLKRRSSLYGSRRLTYEIPLLIDEYNIEDVSILREGSRRNRNCHSLELGTNKQNVFRVSSLQPQSSKSNYIPVSRMISSPMALYESRNRIGNDYSSKAGFRQFINRLSWRRIKNEGAYRSRKNVKISASFRSKSIAEEVHDLPSRFMSEPPGGESIIEDESSIIDANEIENEITFAQEERKYGEIPFKIYEYYIKSCSILAALTCGLTTLIWQCVRTCTDFWLKNWADEDSTENGTYYFNIYVFISNLCILASLLSTSTGQIAGSRARKNLHSQLLHSTISKPLNFFQITPTGRILNRFTNDISIVDKKIAPTIQRLIQFTLMCLFAILINIIVTPWFIVLTIPVCTAYYFIQKFYRSSSRELQRIESLTSSPVVSHFTETIQGVRSIRAYSQESRFTELLFKKLEAHTAAFVVLNSSNRWLGIALDCLGGIVVFGAIITALIIDASSTSIRFSPSMIGLAINYTLFVPIYLNWVVKLLADMEMYIGAVERISELSADSSAPAVIYKPVPISWPTKGDIEFRNVSLRYQGDNKQPVIKNVSLKIPFGQRIGICGRTGSGKSSLALSLFGFLEIVEGEIFVDNFSLVDINPDEIKSRLSIIPQDVYLFNASIRENLDPHGYYTDLQLWKCLEIAQLKDLVNGFPKGIDTKIVDGGSNFSTGQRQLFCLARAVLKGSFCLILDEATSCLDKETELALLSTSENAFKGRTIISIAHRLLSILNYDRIIVLENGMIVEDGHPNMLKSIPNGKFVAMLKAATM